LVGDCLVVLIFVCDFLIEIMLLICDYCFKFGVIEKWDLYVCGFELVMGYFELVDFVI